MRTSHNDSVKDPRTTAITINEEALHKEEFEFKSQTKTERALKTLQRLSGLTTLLSTYQLIPMTLSLANDPSSFNILSTSLASVSLILSLGLAYWSTRVLKSEQSRHLLAQDLNWEGLNTGLFVTLLMRAALSLVLIPNFLLQSGNTPSHMVDSGLTTGQSSQINMAKTISNLSVPLPLIELMVFFVFLSAAKTTFSHIKQSGRAMSSLIFFANIAMLSTALGLVFSVLRLKAFPFQGNFALLFPSWNLNGLLRLGAITSFTSFVVWFVNFKRWRVPSVFTSLIVGALVLGITALSISGYSNAHSVEREHGPEFARAYLGFSNLGMLSAVFGALVFLGGSYFWKRHYNFIETNRKRNLAGFAVLVGFVLVFAAARTFYWQPFVTSHQGFSTKTYTNVEAKVAPQMTIREAMLSQYLLKDLNSLDKGIKDTTKDLNNAITLFENAKRRGFFPKELTTQLWSFTESVDQYEEYAPKTAAMELWQLFGSLDNLQNQLDDASEGVAENSRAIRNYATQLWPWSKSLPEESEDYKDILPKNGVVSKLWSLFGSLDEAQASIDDAKLQLETTKAIYQDAQNKAVVANESTTEFWPWSSSLGDVEGYKSILPEDGVNQLWWFFNKVSSAHTKLKEAAQEVRASTKAIANATTSLWPSRMAALSDYRNYVPQEQELQFWSLFGSVNDVENNLNDVNSQLDDAQATFQDAQKQGLVPQGSAAELWSAWANSLKNYKTHEEVIPQAVSRLWSLFGSLDKAEESLNDASLKASNTKASIEEAQSQGVLPTEKTVEAWSSHWQDNLPSRMVTRTWFSGWHEVKENLPPSVEGNNTTQLWGDHWSVVDKLPSFLRLRSTPTPTESIWNSDYVTEFPREAATQLFLWFGKVNSLEDSVNAAKEKVGETKAVLDTAKTKGLIYDQNSTATEMTQEQLMAFWSLFGKVNELKDSVNQASEQIKDAQGESLAANTELWPWSDSLNEYNQYKEVLPKIALTEFWSLFGSSSELQESLADSAQQIQDIQSQGVWNDTLAEKLPKDISTQLWSLFGSLSNAQDQVNEANSKMNSMNNMMTSAQNLGLVSRQPSTPSQLWSWSNAVDTVDKYREYLPVETVTAFWSLFSSVSDLTDTIDETNKQFQEATERGALPAPNATETWTADWVDQVPKESATQLFTLWNSLNNVQSSLNNANQKIYNAKSIYRNAENLGLVSKDAPNTANGTSQLWGWSHSLQDTTIPSQLWSLWGSLNEAENAARNANENLDNVEAAYQNAQDVGEGKVNSTESDTTELWSLFGWLTGAQSSLNTANQKLANVENIYSNAESLGLVNKSDVASSQLFAFSNALNNVQSQLSAANRKVSNAQSIYYNAQNLGLANRPGSSTTQLWSLFGWLTGAQSSLNSANQKLANVQSMVSNAQNLGLVDKQGASTTTASTTTATPTTAPTTELFFLWNWLTGAQSSLNNANQKLANIQSIASNAQNLGLVSNQGASTTIASTTATPTAAPTVELWSWFTNSVNSAQASLDDANQKLANVQSVYNNAQDNITTAPSELWTLSSSLNSIQSSLNDANRKVYSAKSIYNNAQNLGLVSRQSSTASAPTTATWTWFSNSLDNAQGSLNSANQKLSNVKSIYNNAENLGLVSQQESTTVPTTVSTTELWSLFGWLTGAQSSLNTANQKLANVQNIVSNAQNLGLINKDGAPTTTTVGTTATPTTTPQTTELWGWFGKSLDSAQASLDEANQKLANAQSVYNNAQNLSTAATPETTELWSLFGWLTGAQSSLNTANQKLANAKNIYTNAQNLGLVSKESSAPTDAGTSTTATPTTPSTTELFFLWNWLTGAQNSLNTANQKLANIQSIASNAQNLGLVNKDGSTQTTTPDGNPTPAPTAELWSWFTSSLNSAQASLNDANQKLANAESVFNNATAVPSELWSASKSMDDTLNKYEEYVPKTMELWTWFSNSLNDVQSQLNSANQKVSSIKNTYSSAENLGQNLGVNKQDTTTATDASTTTPNTTEMWAWFSNSLDNAQDSLNSANQKLSNVKSVYSNAENLGLVGTVTPATTPETTELFFLWNWLTGAQNSLNTANQKLANVQSIYNNAENLGLVDKQGSAATTPTTTTTTPSTTATPSELWSASQTLVDTMDKYEEYVPKTMELWTWFTDSIDSAQASLNDANQNLANIQSIANNVTATPSELWSASKTVDDTLNKYEGYVPKTTELWAWFSNSLNKAQSQLNAANQKVSNIKSSYTSAETLGNNLGLTTNSDTTNATTAPDTTEMWTWFSNSLNNIQGQLNSANQKVSNVKSIYSNAQNLGLVSKDNAATPSTTATPSELWSASQTLDDAMSKYEEYVPKVVQLWSLFGWLSGAQTSLNNANQKIANVKNIYTNAENLGLISKTDTSANAGTAATPTTTTTTATPSQLWSWSQPLDDLDDSGVIPKEVIAELWGIFGSLSDLETSVQDANQQIEEAKATYQNSQGELTPEAETKLWSLFGSLSKVEDSLNNATDKIENAQNTGLIPSRDTVDDYNAQWLENVSREGATEFWSLFGSLDNLDSSLSDTKDEIEGVKVTYQGAEEQGLVGKEGELTRLFWPFTRPKSKLEIAEETVQETAKNAYDAVASAASTSQEKVKNAYNVSQEKVKSAYNTVSSSVSSSAAELKQKAEELTNRAEHVKADVDHARSDSDHINRDSAAIQGQTQNQNPNQNQAK